MSAAIMSSDDMKLETAPSDPRFPNQNQTRFVFLSQLVIKWEVQQ